MGPNRSWMLPDNCQTLLAYFLEKELLSNNLGKCREIHELSTGRKTILFWKIHANNKDLHRHGSNFDGPMSSPSFIWIPFLKNHKIVMKYDFMSSS